MILQESKEILIAHSNYSLPEDHLTYLKRLANSYYPVIIYDIGACVMTWTKAAQKIWPKSKIFLFDATDSVEFLYQENEYQYSIGVLSDVEGKEVVFYQNSTYPHGNSYYKEYSSFTDMYYPISTRRIVKTQTLDNIVQRRNFPTPDLIKIDVQGAEIDILKGMTFTLQNCKHLLIELQHSQYNTGAPLASDSIPFIESLGFKLITPLFCNNGPDGDYHFVKD